jgi:sugar fermentation stimulation protein A
MIFSPPLVKGILLKRYKRFLCDIQLESGEIITAHCPNPGAMMGLTHEGETVFLSYSTSPSRKLPYTWEMVQTRYPVFNQPEKTATFIGMNTMNPNRLVKKGLESGFFKNVFEFSAFQSEVRYGANSRIDFILKGPNGPCYLEVKNVHLCRHEGLAEFPDCETSRGAKHLMELSKLAITGIPCFVMYIVQRNDVHTFQVAKDLDVKYAIASQIAKENGVTMLAFSCHVSTEGIFLYKQLKVL